MIRFAQALMFALIGMALAGCAAAGIYGNEEAFADFAFSAIGASVTLWLLILFEEWPVRHG
jgi:hypothetical protein